MKFTTIATLLATTVAFASAALPVQPAPLQEDSNQEQNILGHKPFSSGGKSYIVVFKQSAAAHIIEKAERDVMDFGGKIGNRYSAALKGFSAWIPNAIVQALQTNPFIDYIEEDNEERETAPDYGYGASDDLDELDEGGAALANEYTGEDIERLSSRMEEQEASLNRHIRDTVRDAFLYDPYILEWWRSTI
ncbi:hypothetical protein BGX28_004587 [Mortierella sp. GBA30]|nr:hypothetical protein BGX28_004587 [Mortierella sp. GBA30]